MLPAVFFLASAVLRAPACPGVFRKGKLFLFLRYPVDCGDHRVATATPWPVLSRRGCQPSKNLDFFLFSRAPAKKRFPSGFRLFLPVDLGCLFLFLAALPLLLRLCFPQPRRC